MSNATAGVGTKFMRKDPISDVYSAITQIQGFNGPNQSKDTIDVTSMDSLGGYREFIGSFKDGGEITFDMLFSNDSYKLMQEDFESDSTIDYRIDIPNLEATKIAFTGFVTTVPVQGGTDDAIKMSVSIKITGPVEVTDNA